MSSWITVYDYVIWIATAVCEAALLSLILRFRAVSSQWAICLLLVMHLCADPVMYLWGKDASGAVYLRAFTTYLAADYVVQFYLIWELFRAVKTHDVSSSAGFGAVFLVVGTCAFSVYVGAGSISQIIWGQAYAFLTRFDATLSYARCCFLAEVFFFAWLIQAPWSKSDSNRFLGFSLYALAQLSFVQTEAVSSFAGHQVCRVLPGLVYLITLALWSSAVYPSKPLTPIAADALADMKRQLASSVLDTDHLRHP